MKTTIFTWGYHGWGKHTRKLVDAVDAAETRRGFHPPMFVDIRFERSGRASGFSGGAFERLLGKSRYRWMKCLGNRSVKAKMGPKIQINDPAAADTLLDLAIERARSKQRLVVFCHCASPRYDGKIACHRATVAGLVLKSARRRGLKIEVAEWPGGQPQRIDLEVTPKIFAAICNLRRTTVPLNCQADLADVVGLPGCSIATLHSDGEKVHRGVGPAIPQSGGLALPVWHWFSDPATRLNEYKNEAAKLRKEWGLEAAVS